METTHQIKPGCGYWDVTNYPIGGCFKRTKDGLPVTPDGIPQMVKGYGYLAFFTTEDGRKVCTQEQNFAPVS